MHGYYRRRVSVCLSHAGIVPKRLKVGSRKQRRVITVHTWIAGDVSIYLKFALKVTHPFRKCQFRHISLNNAAGVKVSEKSSNMANRKSTMSFPSSHRWTPYITPNSPKGRVKTKIFTSGIAFHFFVAGNRRHFKFGTTVEHCKSQPTDDKPSLKLAWSRYVTHFKSLVPLRYLWNDLS